MNRIRIATIGTSMISEDMLDAAAQVEDVEYVGTFSRRKDTARSFTERHGGTRPFASLDELAASEAVDAVYVASPNSAHYEQALACIAGGKHVIVEKTFCPNRYQAQQLFAAADVHGVVAMEAMRSIHDPGWATIFATLPKIGRLRRATLRFGKYSSRYDELLAGHHTNIFDAQMATGALMDIGIYCVEPMVAAFGAPARTVAQSVLVGEKGNELTEGAIDGAGSVLCSFDQASGAPGLVVELAYSKISQDLLPCQVEGELGTITIDAVSAPQRATLHLRGRAVRGGATTAAASVGDVTEELALKPCKNNMVYELIDFVRLVRGEAIDTFWGPSIAPDSAQASFGDVTLSALAITDEIRHQAGIEFPADLHQQ